MNTPKSIWVIFDNIGDPLTFVTEVDALKYYDSYQKGIETVSPNFWNISKPLEFKIAIDK